MLDRGAIGWRDVLRRRLDRSLADGDVVVIVKASDNQAEVVDLLTNHGGRFLWQFREWTFNSAGSA